MAAPVTLQQQLLRQQLAARALQTGGGGVSISVSTPQVVVPGAGKGVTVAPRVTITVPAVQAQGGSSQLTVSGCQTPTVAEVVRGSFTHQGNNHGRPVYSKDGTTEANTVLIYFWDDRDGPKFGGWWFGPKVGGDQVWAYNGDKVSVLPPIAGWQVPWDGPVDATLRVIARPRVVVVPPPGGAPGAAGVVMPQQPQLLQQPQQPAMSAISPQQLEERRRQMEESRQKQLELVRRQEELRKKREEEEVRRQEQAAALIVRKAIQRVRIATPENYDQLRAELEKTQSEQLEKMGSQAEKVLQEAEKAMLQAQERVENAVEKRLAEEKRQFETEARRNEEAVQLTRLVQSGSAEVEAAEAKVAAAEEAAAPFKDAADDVSESLLEATAAVEAALAAAQSALDEASKSVFNKQEEAQQLDKDTALPVLRDEIRPFFGRLAIGRRKVESCRQEIADLKDRLSRKAAALRKEREQRAQFDSFDLDQDGKLNREEVIAFSKAEFSFEPSEEHLDRVFKALAGGSPAVPFEMFQRLRSMVAIAKSEVKAREKRIEEEEKARLRKAEEERHKQEQEAKMAEMAKARSALASLNVSRLCVAQALAASLAEDQSLAARFGALCGDGPLSRAQFDELLQALPDVSLSAQEVDELFAFLRGEDAVGEDSGISLDRFVDVLQLRYMCIKNTVLTLELNIKSKTVRRLEEGELVEVLEGPKKELETGIERVRCRAKDDDAEGWVTVVSNQNTAFLEAVQNFYTCARETVLTDNLPLQGSKTLRRVAKGEIVELLEYPRKDARVSVRRVRARSKLDGAEGWVTVRGHQSTVFLEPC